MEPALKSQRQEDPLERMVDTLMSESTAIFVCVEFIPPQPLKCGTARSSGTTVTTKKMKRGRRRSKE